MAHCIRSHQYLKTIQSWQKMLFNIIVEDLPHVSVSPKEGDDYIYLYRTLVERIWAIPGVAAVSPSLGTSATFTYKENVENKINGILEDIDKLCEEEDKIYGNKNLP